jgi:hypothetical protein
VRKFTEKASAPAAKTAPSSKAQAAATQRFDSNFGRELGNVSNLKRSLLLMQSP